MFDLVSENNPILKQKTKAYDFDNPIKFADDDSSIELGEFIDFMFFNMLINKGIGLAAPQVGESVSIFVMMAESEEITCINPQIIEVSTEELLDKEGCLSFPQLRLNIKRPKSVYASYQNIDGKSLTRWFHGLPARCFLHELDHLNGVTFDTKAGKLSLKMGNNKRKTLLKQQKRKK